MNIPVAHSQESVERFLKHMVDAPVPQKVNRSYLKSHGFVSGNDPELQHIFRILGFLDDSGSPTASWADYKKKGRDVLRAAVERTYGELFKLYPDAPQRSASELMTWFRPPVTGDAASAIERAIRTFRKLCQLAGITSALSEQEARSTNLQNVTIPSVTIGNTWDNSIVIKAPNFKNQSDYIRFFEAIKKVFYE